MTESSRRVESGWTRRKGLWCPGSDGSPGITGGHGCIVCLRFSVAPFTGAGTEEAALDLTSLGEMIMLGRRI